MQSNQTKKKGAPRIGQRLRKSEKTSDYGHARDLCEVHSYSARGFLPELPTWMRAEMSEIRLKAAWKKQSFLLDEKVPIRLRESMQ
jgi:hypothetical protein